ncbi:MAG: YdcF family protein, partial [Clostridia bacterium]|nr:YdcF family protein [Clostridia bacterium]
DCITTLGEAGEFVRGPFGGSLKKEIFQKSGYAVYEQQHAIYGAFTFRYFVNEEKYLSMKRFAVNAGVPSEDVFMDHAGFSTYETMYRAKEVFGAKKVVIVTQEYHLYRSIYIAEKLGMEAYGVASDYKLDETREILARCKDFMTTIVKPKPACSGATYSIKGNGNLTNAA